MAAAINTGTVAMLPDNASGGTIWCVRPDRGRGV